MKFHKEMTQKAVYSFPNSTANVRHIEKKIQNLGHTFLGYIHRGGTANTTILIAQTRLIGQ